MSNQATAAQIMNQLAEVELNPRLANVFSSILGRQLVLGNDGHLEPTPLFTQLVGTFTWVAIPEVNRPEPFSPDDIATTVREVLGNAGEERELIRQVVDIPDKHTASGVEIELDAETEPGTAVRFDFSTPVPEDIILVKVTITNFSAGDVVDLSALDDTHRIKGVAIDNNGNLVVNLETTDLFPLPREWRFTFTDVADDIIDAVENMPSHQVSNAIDFLADQTSLESDWLIF